MKEASVHRTNYLRAIVLPAAAGQFVIHALEMGLVLVVLTLGMALFTEAIVGVVRKTLPYVQPVSAVFMVLAGSYIVFYWLTIGGLAETLTS